MTVYEEGSIELAAEKLSLTSQEVQDIVDQYIPRKEERRTNLGERVRQLERIALKNLQKLASTNHDE